MANASEFLKQRTAARKKDEQIQRSDKAPLGRSEDGTVTRSSNFIRQKAAERRAVIDRQYGKDAYGGSGSYEADKAQGFSSWVKDVGSLSDRLSQEYSSRQGKYQSGKDFSRYRSDADASLAVLQNRANAYRTFFQDNADRYDPKQLQEALGALDQYGTYLSSARSDLGKEQEYWDSFADRDAYDLNQKVLRWQAAPQAADYAEKSQYKTTKRGEAKFNAWTGTYTDTGYDDVFYDYINGDKDAQSMQGLNDLGGPNTLYATTHDYWKDLPEDTVKTFNYIYATEGKDAAYEYLNMTVDKSYTGIEAVALGALNGTGLSSVSAALGAGASKLTGNEEAAKRNREWYTGMLQEGQAAQEEHPYAYGTGAVGGNLALAYGLGSGIGAGVNAGAAALRGGITIGGSQVALNVSPLVTKMATNALTFAATDAVQNAGGAATGLMSGGDYAKGIGISGAAGLAGGLAEGLTSTGIATLLRNKGLMTPFGEFVRATTSSTASAWANIGTEYALSENKPSQEEMATQLATAFALSLLQSGISTYQTTTANKAKMEAAVATLQERYAYLSQNWNGMTPAERAEMADFIIGFTQETRSSLNRYYMAGQQSTVNSLNGALDTIEAAMQQYATGFANAKAAATAPGNILPGSGAAAAGGQSAADEELKQLMSAAVEQGLSTAGGQGPTEPTAPASTQAVPGGTAPAAGAAGTVTEQLIAAGATERQAATLAPAVEAILRGEEITGNDAGRLARSGAAVSLLETVTGQHIDTDAPLAQVKAEIRSLAARQQAADAREAPAVPAPAAESTAADLARPIDGTSVAPAATDTPAMPESTAAAAGAAQAQSERNARAVADFAKTMDKAGATALTSMYSPGQDAEGYIAGMMKAYSAGKKGGSRAEILNNLPGITGPQARAAYLAGQADATPAQGGAALALSGESGYTGENQSGYDSLAQRLDGYNMAVADGIRYSITQTADGYRVSIDRAKGTGGYVTDARANAYQGGPFATREEAVSDLLSVARSNFYPEQQRAKEDWEDIDGKAIGAELARRKATGQSPVGQMLRQAEQIADKQFGTKKKEGKDNGTGSVEAVSDGRGVLEPGNGRKIADGLLGAVQAQDVPGAGRGGDAAGGHSDAKQLSGRDAREPAEQRPAGGRGDGLRAGGALQPEAGRRVLGQRPAVSGVPGGGAAVPVGAQQDQAELRGVEEKAEEHPVRKGSSEVLTEEEQAALLAYKSSESYKINAKLRGEGTLTAADKAFVRHMDSALTKMPTRAGKVYRNITFDGMGDKAAFDAFMAGIEPGGFIQPPAYTSTSTTEDGYPLEGQYVVHMVIEGQSGRDMAGVGNNFESEVLFERDRQFTIESVTYSKDGTPTIYMKEAAIHEADQGGSVGPGADGPDLPRGNGTGRKSVRGSEVQPVQEVHSGDGHLPGVSERNSEGDLGEPTELPEVREEVNDTPPAPATTAEQTAQKEALGSQEKPRGENYVIPAKGGAKIPTTPKGRYSANAAAIKTLRSIAAEGRLATPKEQEILARYTGWGGLSDVFDEKKTDWAKEYKQLQKLLDKDEYKTARGSILDAYYTEPSVIQGMYNGLAKLGFTGGRLLEPSAGVGRFLGAMPAELREGVKSWTAVELDKITGSIAKYLYPNADVRVQGFETAKIPEGYMDLVIGNVPFGNLAVADRAYPGSVTKAIHNYFISKSLTALRPGGIACLITSSGTMDALSTEARAYFMKQADLIGAVRLPNTAFQGTGTSVVSDILVFQKREPGTPYKGEAFLEVGKKPWEGANRWGSYDQNEYFVKHPEMVLGTADYGKGQYGRTVVTYNPLESRYSLQTQIERAMAKIQRHMTYPAKKTAEEVRAEIKKAAAKGRSGSLVQKNGKLYRNVDGQLAEAKGVAKGDAERIGGMLTMRDTARELLNLQLDGGSDAQIAAYRKALNSQYDAFVKKYGILHSKKNKKLAKQDADWPFLLALEDYDEDTDVAQKAALFTQNTVSPIKTVTHADNTEEALTVVLNEDGRADLARIAQLTGMTEEAAQADLLERGLAFLTRDGGLESAEQYLSGNVRAKLRDAEALAEADSRYQRNVEALKAVVPADIPADEIKVRLGATWIPDNVYSQFATEMVGGGSGWVNGHRVPAVTVTYNRQVGKFFVEINDAYVRSRPENISTWGTGDRPFVGGQQNILEAALNNRTLSVWRTVGDQRVMDRQATAAAQEKLEQVLSEFQTWLWKDEGRRTELSGLYNEVFNNMVTPHYDGSHLTVNGMNSVKPMRPHQLDAVQRIINSGGNTLLAHRVGAGKTYEMAAAAMKLRQLGIVKKPLFIVPKNLVAQWSNEFLSYFPTAKIQALEDGDFTPANRKMFANRIATGDYDAVIMSYEQFTKVPMSLATREAFYQEQVDQLEEAILQSRRASGKKDPSVRDMERSKRSLEAELRKLSGSKKDEDSVDFEELGVDSLFVDEAHNFKNLFYTTKMQGIADLGNKGGSQRSLDLYMKVRWLQKLNGGRGVVFATATPVMNSVVELYTMQRYLQPDLLEAKGISNFDAWANQFGNVVTIRKMKTGGNGYELKQSLSKYKNLGEMQQMFRAFADVIVDASELPYLKIPKMTGGKRTVVECDPSPFQEQFMQELGKRAEALRGSGKGKGEDHIFKIFDDGKKISYTQRLIDSSLPYEDGGKILKCVENVARIWKESKARKGTQLIFCDRGTPGGAEAARGVSLYEDIKNLLVGRGIPAKEIAFIHDANTDEAKTKLFQAVKDGKVRVLIGSTATMGTGMNAQDRIVAMHELNAPDRPGDLEQNEGRALRQGNQNDEVSVFAYVTKKTFDSRQWDNLKRKATFIHQIMAGEYNGREADGDGDLAMSAAEISAIASDNPLIIEQFEVSEKISGLETLERAHTKEVAEAKDRIQKTRRQMATDEVTLEHLKSDLASRQDTTGAKFRMVVGGKTYTERKAAGAALIAAAKKQLDLNAATESSVEVGSFAGFRLLVTSKGDFLLKGEAQYRGTLNLEDGAATVMRAQNAAERIETMIQATERRLEESRAAIAQLEKTAAAPFAKAKELIDARVREAEILKELNPPTDEALDIAEDAGDTEAMLDEYDEAEGPEFDRSADAAPHPERWTAQRVGDSGKAPMRLSDIIEKIHHDYGLNITKGHIRGKGVRGQYDHRSKGIRTKIANDLPTTAHELGHALNDRWGILESGLSAAMKKELSDGLGAEMLAAYPPKAYVSEGFAEYIRKFLQNRETAAIDYPEFTRHFLNRISPKDAAQLEQLADEINAYYALDADTATSSIRFREEGGADARTWGEKIQQKAHVLYQAWLDSNHGIHEFDKATGANTYRLASNAAYSDAMAGQIITGDLTDANGQYVGPGLKAALQGLNLSDAKEYRLFGEYLTVKHGPERLAEGMRIFADDRKNSSAWMENRQAQLEAQYPQFKEISQRLYEFQKEFLQTWGVGTGLVSTQSAEDWADRWQYYVPFNRAVSPERRGQGAKRGFANQTSTIKQAHGSGLDIVHPVDNIVANIVKMVNAGVRNNVMRRITDEAQRLGIDASFLEKVPTPVVRKGFDMTGVKTQLTDWIEQSSMQLDGKQQAEGIISSLDDVLYQYGRGKAHGDVITVLKGGNQEFWKINDPLLLQSLTNMSQKKLDGILDAYAMVSRFMTGNITGNNIIWSLFSNFPRDLGTFFVYSKVRNPAKVFSSMGSAYVNKIKGENADPMYKEFLAMGGGNTSAYTADRDLAKKARKSLSGKKFSANPLDWIAFVSDTVETGPRYATYKLMRQAGMNPQEAFYEAMDITVNFRRGGDIARQINKVVPFFNASVQGLDKFRRWISGGDAPTGERAKVVRGRVIAYLVASAALAALFYALNNGDEEAKEDYHQLSNYTKNSYWNIPLGDGKYFSIPKPRELAVLSSFFETCMEYGEGGNKYAFDEFYDYATDNFLPSVASDLAKGDFSGAIGSLGIVGVGAYMMANRDFLGRPIVSSGLQNLEPKDQYTERTSKIAYWVGQAFNTSPQMVDYFFNATLGGWWKYQKALFPVGSENVDLTLGVQNSYIKDNQYSTDLVNWLYGKAEASQKAKNSDSGNMEKAITYKMDDSMKTFYSRYYALAKNNPETTYTRGTRQTVLSMIAEYQKAADEGTTTRSQDAVYKVCEQAGTTEYLPAVMQSTIKDGEGSSRTLSDVQYVEYQTDYLRLYWEHVEADLDTTASQAEQVAVLKAARDVAKEEATNRTLARIGAPRTDYFDKYGDVSTDKVIEFKAQADLANDDGSLKQDEIINIIEIMIEDGLSYEDAYALFHSKYDSDKKNPWRRYKP